MVLVVKVGLCEPKVVGEPAVVVVKCEQKERRVKELYTCPPKGGLYVGT